MQISASGGSVFSANQQVWEVFEAERPYLMAYRGPFDGFRAVETAVSKTCLVRFDRNQYSVEARAVGQPVDVQAYADRIVTSARTARPLPSIRAASSVTRSSTIPGTTCRFSRESLAR